MLLYETEKEAGLQLSSISDVTKYVQSKLPQWQEEMWACAYLHVMFIHRLRFSRLLKKKVFKCFSRYRSFYMRSIFIFNNSIKQIKSK